MTPEEETQMNGALVHGTVHNLVLNAKIDALIEGFLPRGDGTGNREKFEGNVAAILQQQFLRVEEVNPQLAILLLQAIERIKAGAADGKGLGSAPN